MTARTWEIDHTADVAFGVEADSREELLSVAAEALSALIVDPKSVTPARSLPIEAPSPGEGWADDDRLFAWLSEVLYQIDTERFAVHHVVVSEDSEIAVRGALWGEPIDNAKHAIHGAIKAVTYHGLVAEQTPSGWRAEVVIDV